MIQRSRNHLQEAGKTYGPHGAFAIKAGFLLFFAGFASIIHGIVPALFPFVARDIVCDLAERGRGERERGLHRS